MGSIYMLGDLSYKTRMLLTVLIKIIRIYESFLLNEALAYGKING